MPAIVINFDGSPLGNPGPNEAFIDFFKDTTQSLVSGYVASTSSSGGGTVHLFDSTADGKPDSFTYSWTDAGVPKTESGTITYATDGTFTAMVTSGTSGGSGVMMGRFAYDSTGQVVGLYSTDLTLYSLTPDTNTTDTLLSTFTISETETGGLFDTDNDGVIDRLGVKTTWIDQNNQSQSSEMQYELTWSDTTHWTANGFYEISFGSTYDDQGRPTTFIAEGFEHSIVWQSKDANNVVATSTYPGENAGETVVVKFIDSIAGGNPDEIIWKKFADVGGVSTKIQSMVGNLVGWTYDASNRPSSVDIVSTTDIFSGIVAGDSRNPTAIYGPSFNNGTGGTGGNGGTGGGTSSGGDRVESNSLIFDLGITGATLASLGTIVLKSAGSYSGLKSVTVDVSNLACDGTFLTVPLSGTDAVTDKPYYFSASSGDNLFIKVPAGVVNGEPNIIKAWSIGGTSNLSALNVIGDGTGSSSADWMNGTTAAESITSGAGDDVIPWSGGNDTVDAGAGNDKLYLPITADYTSSRLDSQGVLHIIAMTMGSGSATGGMQQTDAYRITKLAADSFRIQKMGTDGTTVAATMLLDNAEVVVAGYNTFRLKSSTDGGQYVRGTSWDDEISLDAASISNLLEVSGDSGQDLLVFDVGSGYSAMEVVKSGSAYVLNGTRTSDGTVVVLGQAAPSQYGYGATMTVGTGASAKSFMVYDIEAFRFVSGSVVYNFDPTQFAEVTFSASSYQNNINGTPNADTIDADALGSANNATNHNDYIGGRAGNDSINAGAGNDYIYGGDGNDTIDGGAGTDTVSYNGNKSDYTVTSNGGVITVQDKNIDNGDDGTDTLSGVERLSFYDGSVEMAVSFTAAWSVDAQNTITGTMEADTIDADALGTANSAQTTRDYIDAGAGNDSVKAGLGGDDIRGGAGNDTIDGGVSSLASRLLLSNTTNSYTLDNRASYSGAAKNYRITALDAVAGDSNGVAAGQHYFIVEDARSSSPDGRDIIYNIDALQFNDKQVRLTANLWFNNMSQDSLVTPAGTPAGNGAVTLSSSDFAPEQQLSQVLFYKEQVNGTLYLDGTALVFNSHSYGGYEYFDPLTVAGADIIAGKLTFTPTDPAAPTLRANVTVYNIIADGTPYADSIGYALNETVPAGSYDFSGSDRLTGGGGDDKLYGGAGADTFRGDGGNDTLVGGADRSLLSKATWDPAGSNGYDVAEFSGNASRYTITFKDSAGATVSSFADASTVVVKDSKSASKGGDGEDTLSGIEVLRFSDGEKNLTVLKYENFYYDWQAQDRVITGYRWEGSDFGDTITSTSALRDEVHAKAGNDTVSTGDGGDWIDGGEGNDTIDGGANTILDQWGNKSIDVAWFDAPARRFDIVKNSDGSIQVTDRLGSEFGGLGSDKLINIEQLQFNDSTVDLAVQFNGNGWQNNINGTQFGDVVDADLFVANAGDNHNDNIDTKVGDDVVYAGLGADRIRDGAGNDFYDGGADGTSQNGNNQDVVEFTGAQKRYTIDVLQYDNLDAAVKANIDGHYSGSDIPSIIIRVTDKVPAISGGDGVNYLINVEQIQFGDYSTVNLGVTANKWVSYYSGDWVGTNNYTGGILGDSIDASGHDLASPSSPVDGFSSNRDYIDGGAGNDTLLGGAGGDELRGGLGNDLLDGGGNGAADVHGYYDPWQSLDRATFINSINRYTVQFFRTASDGDAGTRYNNLGVATLGGTFVKSDYYTESGFIVVQDLYDAAHGGEGRDVLRNIEVLQFSDASEQLKVQYQTSSYDRYGYVDTGSGNWSWQITGTESRLDAWGTRFGDLITGQAGSLNNLNGNGGNDSLVGGNLRDDLRGGVGNDTIDGGGNPTPTNPWDNSGYDVAYFDANRSEFAITQNGDSSYTVRHLIPANIGGLGTDIVHNVERLQFSDTTEELTVLVSPASYWDSNTSTWLNYSNYTATNFSDNLADTVAGGQNNFLMRNGNDTVAAGTGNDTVIAGGGNDFVYLDTADVSASGGGDDQANLGTGNDTVYGGTGFDNVYYDDASDRYIVTVHAQAGQSGASEGDLLATFSRGSNLNNGVYSGTLNFTNSALGSSYDASKMYVQVVDTLASQYGGEGTDKLVGIEQVTFEGGILFLEAHTFVNPSELAGLSVQSGDFVVKGNYVGTGGINGTSGADNLVGSDYGDYGDWLQGWAGNDKLNGGAGDDSLNGGLGNDTLIGGTDSTTDRNSYWSAGDTAQYAGAVQERLHISEKLIDADGTVTGTTAGESYYIVTDLASLINKTQTDGVFDYSAGNINSSVGYGQDILVGIERIQIGESVLQLSPVTTEYTWTSYLWDYTTNTSTPYEVTRSYITGTFMDDLLLGTSHGDEIDGKAGNDTIDGGNEDVIVGNPWEVQDVVRYTGSRERYTIKGVLVNPDTHTIIDPLFRTGSEVFGIQITDVLPDSAGGTGTDLLVNIERVEFSGSQLSIKPEIYEYQDTWSIPGTTLTYVNARGTEFDDILNGKSGNDWISGNNGNDTLFGGAGADDLEGGAGNDVLDGGVNGSDSWRSDTARYNASFDRFTVDSVFVDSSYAIVSAGTSDAVAAYRVTDILPASDPASLGTDILVGIENLSFNDRWVSLAVSRWSWSDWQGNVNANAEGTVFNDSITEISSDSRDYMNGKEGNDVLLGGGNGDNLRGGSGNDVLDGGTNGTSGQGWQDQDVAEFSGPKGRYEWSALTTTGRATDGAVQWDGVEVGTVAGGVLTLSPSLSTDVLAVLNLAFTSENLFGKGSGYLVVDTLSSDLGGEGTDLVFNVERFRFNDGEVELGIRADAWDWSGGGENGWEPDGKPDSANVTGTSENDSVTLNDIATLTAKAGVSVETQTGYLEKIRIDIDLKEGDDTYVGGKGGESIRPGSGNDYVDAGLNEGTDQWGGVMRDEVRFEGKVSRYVLEDVTLTKNGTTWSISSERDTFTLTANTTLTSTNATALNLDLAGMQQGIQSMIAHAGTETTVNGWLVIDKLPASFEGTGVDAVVGAEVFAFSDYWMPLTVDTYYQRDWSDADKDGNSDEIISASVRGTDSGDTIKGNATYDFTGSDWIEGNGGNDKILAGAGGDYIRGGAGDDTIDGGANGTTDQSGYTPSDTAQYSGGYDRYVITSGTDVNGRNFVEVRDLETESGDGTDTLYNIENLSFSDRWVRLGVESYVWRDWQTNKVNGVNINGSMLADRIDGSADTYVGVTHHILGMEGNDTLIGGSGPDNFQGGTGDDEIIGGDNGVDQFGNPGSDVVNYDGMSDRYTVTILADGEKATIDGHEYTAGADGTIVQVVDSMSEEDGGNGTDLLIGVEAISFWNKWMPLQVTQSFTDFNGDGKADEAFQRGTDGADSLTGGAINDRIEAGDGNDTINAGGGGDIVSGGAGDDTIDGGDNGTDPYGNELVDVAIYSGNYSDYTISSSGGIVTVIDNRAASDTVVPDGTDTLSNVESLQFSDRFISLLSTREVKDFNYDGVVDQIVLRGTDLLGDTLEVSAEESAINHLFEGLAGNDSLIGGTGNDNFEGGAGNDTISGGAGKDKVFYSGDSTDYDVVMPSGADASFTVTHNNGGSDGADTLSGIEELIFADKVVKVVVGGADAVVTSLLLDTDGDKKFDQTIWTGTDNADTITGTLHMTNVIDSGAGSDSLTGANLADTFRPGSGNDTVDGGANEGVDANGLHSVDLVQFSGNKAAYTIHTLQNAAFTLTGAVEAGDIYTVEVGSQSVVYTATGTSLTTVATGLAAAIQSAIDTDSTVFSATAVGSEITLTGEDMIFAVTPTVTNGTRAATNANGVSIAGVTVNGANQSGTSLTVSSAAGLSVGDYVAYTVSTDLNSDGDTVDTGETVNYGPYKISSINSNTLTLNSSLGASPSNGAALTLTEDNPDTTGAVTAVTYDRMLTVSKSGETDILRNVEKLLFDDQSMLLTATSTVKGESTSSGIVNTTYLKGTSLADLFHGTDANEVFTGGAGSDHFVLGDHSGVDQVRDFTAGSGGDVLTILLGAGDSDGLNGTGVDTISEIMARAGQQGSDTLVNLGDGNSILLVGVSSSDMTAANYEIVHAASF